MEIPQFLANKSLYLVNGVRWRSNNGRLSQNSRPMSSIESRGHRWPWMISQGHFDYFKAVIDQNLPTYGKYMYSKFYDRNKNEGLLKVTLVTCAIKC